MAGFGYAELLRKAWENKKPEGSPSTTLPSQPDAPVVDQSGGTPSAPLRKRDRPHTSGSKDVDNVLPHKKPKGVREKETSKRHSPQLDLERPSESDLERFKAVPLLFAAEISRAGSRLLAKMKQGEEERIAGMLLSAKNLWLEGDNLDKSDKLTRAYEHILELRQQLEAAKKKSQESEAALKPTADALEKAHDSLKSVEKERDTAVTNLSRAEEELRVERVKVGELEEKLIGLEKRVEKADSERDNSKDDFKRLIQSTVDLCQERFDEAIREVKYVYPHYEISDNIIRAAHTIVDGRIVVPKEKDSEGNVILKEVVIYERPA